MPILDPADNHVALKPKVRRALEAYCEAQGRFVGEVINDIVAKFLAGKLAPSAPQHLAQELLTAVYRNADLTIRIRPRDIQRRGRAYVRDGKPGGTTRYVDAKSTVQVDVRAETLNHGTRTHVSASQDLDGTARAIADALMTLNTASEP